MWNGTLRRLVFDLDGTLVDSAPISPAARRRAAEEGLAVPELDKGASGLWKTSSADLPESGPADLERIVRIYRALPRLPL
ncbi:MAG: HAD family hydrolase [Bilophila wadsworthia]